MPTATNAWFHDGPNINMGEWDCYTNPNSGPGGTVFQLCIDNMPSGDNNTASSVRRQAEQP